MRVLINQEGNAVALLDDNFNICNIKGKLIGYIYSSKVYLINNKQVGWYIDGWIRDNKGYCVFFDQTSTGGPTKPKINNMNINIKLRNYPPIKNDFISINRPTKRCAWSRYSNANFFNEEKEV